jgi:hypothetical protein
VDKIPFQRGDINAAVHYHGGTQTVEITDLPKGTLRVRIEISSRDRSDKPDGSPGGDSPSPAQAAVSPPGKVEIITQTSPYDPGQLVKASDISANLVAGDPSAFLDPAVRCYMRINQPVGTMKAVPMSMLIAELQGETEDGMLELRVLANRESVAAYGDQYLVGLGFDRVQDHS